MIVELDPSFGFLWIISKLFFQSFWSDGHQSEDESDHRGKVRATLHESTIWSWPHQGRFAVRTPVWVINWGSNQRSSHFLVNSSPDWGGPTHTSPTSKIMVAEKSIWEWNWKMVKLDDRLLSVIQRWSHNYHQIKVEIIFSFRRSCKFGSFNWPARFFLGFIVCYTCLIWVMIYE